MRRSVAACSGSGSVPPCMLTISAASRTLIEFLGTHPLAATILMERLEGPAAPQSEPAGDLGDVGGRTSVPPSFACFMNSRASERAPRRSRRRSPPLEPGGESPTSQATPPTGSWSASRGHDLRAGQRDGAGDGLSVRDRCGRVGGGPRRRGRGRIVRGRRRPPPRDLGLSVQLPLELELRLRARGERVEPPRRRSRPSVSASAPASAPSVCASQSWR